MKSPVITVRDLELISALQHDGRMPLATLAERLGTSVYAVTERYRRLTSSGIMAVVPVANPLAFSNYCQVIVGLRVNGHRDEALAQLQSMREVTYVVTALGDADIIAEAVIYSNAAMDRFLKRDLRSLPGLERVEVFSCGNLILDDHNVSVVNQLLSALAGRSFATKTEANVGAGVDVSVLEPSLADTFNVLQRDGRASYQTVGEALGVTHTAVRGRVRRLEDSGLMRIMATVSPMRLGGFRQGFVGLSLRPPQLMDVRSLTAIDEVTYVMSGVGMSGADYLIEIIAPDDESLWRVIDERIRPLPGVEQVWWASTVSVEKETYWLDPVR
ncbi:Lrp/AsnC family transcriptional regulator [Bifidobacterium sp. UBA744]|uniref:Lrp/AsnC family transcriptional regulator n=1 Tax=Bifidobacterium sp. UBA744 TaxID=1946112 RepID=UPI0025BF0955|nr:Lrp/AsnC family transcriptional regulator [Bifidobacterium sp. UBA744]